MPGRSFDALQRALAKGEVQPVYYFFGDEELLKDDAVRQIMGLAVEPSTRDFNLDRRRAPELSADQFRSLVETPPMLAARRCVVLTEVECLQQRRPKQQALRTAVTGYVARPSPETVLVLVQSAGEKADPALERGTTAVDFEALEPARIVKWIRHRAKEGGLALDDDAASLLQETVGDDLPQLAAELAKLGTAIQGRAATAADVGDLVGVRHGETAGDFVNAVTGRRYSDAAAMIPRLLAGPGNTGVRLVSSLGTALIGLALARVHLDAGESRPAAAGRVLRTLEAVRPPHLGSYRAVADRWVDDASRWTAAELDQGLAALLRADARLKNTAVTGEGEIVAECVLSLGTAERTA